MGELKDKAAGHANDLAGKVKEGVGAATSNPELEAEGEAQQLKGKTQKLSGDVKGALGDKI
jgi:uncharacterized protein YjbJ (UPF0337 family)